MDVGCVLSLQSLLDTSARRVLASVSLLRVEIRRMKSRDNQGERFE